MHAISAHAAVPRQRICEKQQLQVNSRSLVCLGCGGCICSLPKQAVGDYTERYRATADQGCLRSHPILTTNKLVIRSCDCRVVTD